MCGEPIAERGMMVFGLFSFPEYPVASGLRSRSGYFGGVGCCGEFYSREWLWRKTVCSSARKNCWYGPGSSTACK